MAIRYPFVLEILDLYKKEYSKVLDVGAGTGIYGESFAPGMYTGIDIDVSLSDKVIQGSALNMPFLPNSFDIAFGVASIYLAGPNCLSEIYRVLKPGGTFLVFDYQRKVLKRLREKSNIDHVIWSPHELRCQLRHSGFNYVKRISHRPVRRSYYLQPVIALKLKLRGSWVIFVCQK